MSAKLNKTRIRDTKIIIILSFIVILFTRQKFSYNEDEVHETIEEVGLLLVSLCAMGRIYCTAFLGGFKNSGIIDYGPFSVCRNPLYLFSLIGILGISVMSVNLIAIIIMPLGCFLVFNSLIKREEYYLQDKFGETYNDYKHKTPALWPNFKLYHAPHKVDMTPKTMLRAMKDSIMWFIAYPVLEIIEYMQDAGYIKAFTYTIF